MVLVIDNYDSFTYNLVQYLGELQVELAVRRNDQLSVEEVRGLNPERIVISPGPCTPREAGVSNDVIRELGERVPVLGVCLGHQCIGHTFGACGVTELILFCGMAERGYFPAAPGICAEPSDLEIRLPQTPLPIEPGIFQLNFFGFGGNNTSLVIANVG